MTVRDRLQDISERSGFSESIVRAVLDAERESIIESLKRGEKATLIGRCTLIPTMRNKLINTEMRLERYVAVTAKPSSIIKAEMGKVSEYKSTNDSKATINPNIAIRQIASLV